MGGVVQDFMRSNLARPWVAGDVENGEDCDIVSAGFVAFCITRGVRAELVEVQMTSPHEDLLDRHFFAVLTGTGLAIDFTARQFHNCIGVDRTIDSIPCPFTFPWPGEYPIDTLTATSVDEIDGAPCCPDGGCSTSPCSFPGYAANH